MNVPMSCAKVDRITKQPRKRCTYDAEKIKVIEIELEYDLLQSVYEWPIKKMKRKLVVVEREEGRKRCRIEHSKCVNFSSGLLTT